jgi:SPP1 family predicted phage head-tail adaptor
VKAGELRHRISILAPTSATDPYGQQTEVFESVGDRWAKVEEMPTGEMQIDDGVEYKQRIKATIRALGAKIISQRSKVEYNGLLFNVVSVADPRGEGQMLEIVAERAD